MTTDTAQHTPGPYLIGRENEALLGAFRIPIHNTFGAGDWVALTDERHAPLFRAAPALLAALEGLVSWSVPTPANYATLKGESFTPEAHFLIDMQNQARAAIALARGSGP